MKIKKTDLKKVKKAHLKRGGRIIFWFGIGALLAVFILTGLYYFFIKSVYKDKAYPGVWIGNDNVGSKTEKEIKKIYDDKNQTKQDVTFIFTYQNLTATVSAQQIDFGYDSQLLASQAISIGRSKDPISNLSIILQSNINTTTLPPSYRISEAKLRNVLSSISAQIDRKPVDALFTFKDNRVTAFRPSQDGLITDIDRLNSILKSHAPHLMNSPLTGQVIAVAIPVTKVEPALTTEKVNNLGIKELIGTGTSLFQHSIESRIFNVNLGATRINGILIAPGEDFSFAKAVGDVSGLTGYKQAYVISGGKTVLGDGGGICQVSTTLFRAALNAGLPIVERHAHAYRVGYYEEDSPPGIDATVYVPTVDLKFRNDTGHHILIQTIVDLNELRLTFMLYGTNDGRVAVLSNPVITNQSPAPPDKFEDDPTLPKGVVKQVDFAAAGANVYFTRKVTRNGKQIISDTFTSNYRPWQAVYMRGTQ